MNCNDESLKEQWRHWRMIRVNTGTEFVLPDGTENKFGAITPRPVTHEVSTDGGKTWRPLIGDAT